MESENHDAAHRSAGSIAADEALRAFVEDRAQATDLARRAAWQRCLQLRAAQPDVLTAVSVRAAGRGGSQK